MGERHVRLQAGLGPLAVSAAALVEVIPVERLGPVPGAPPWLLGAVLHRGIPVAVVDLGALAEGALPFSRGDPPALVAVLGTRGGLLAIPVEAVEGEVLLRVRPPSDDHRDRLLWPSAGGSRVLQAERLGARVAAELDGMRPPPARGEARG